MDNELIKILFQYAIPSLMMAFSTSIATYSVSSKKIKEKVSNAFSEISKNITDRLYKIETLVEPLISQNEFNLAISQIISGTISNTYDENLKSFMLFEANKLKECSESICLYKLTHENKETINLILSQCISEIEDKGKHLLGSSFYICYMKENCHLNLIIHQINEIIDDENTNNKNRRVALKFSSLLYDCMSSINKYYQECINCKRKNNGCAYEK